MHWVESETKKDGVLILALDPSMLLYAGMYRTLQRRWQEVRRNDRRQDVSCFFYQFTLTRARINKHRRDLRTRIVHAAWARGYASPV